MPTRKRKAKKRTPSARKRSRRPSRPLLRGPASSSDEDFEVDSDGERSSSGDGEEEEISASDDDEDEDEEEEDDFDDARFSEANSGFSAASSRRRSTRSSRPRPTNRSSSRSRRQNSWDEDFDAVAEGADLAVATRSFTRATVSGQISDALQAAGPRATVSDARSVRGSIARVSGKVSDSLEQRSSTARVSDALHNTGSRGLRESIHGGESSSQIRNEQATGSHSTANSEGTVSGWNNACEGAETDKRKGKEKVLEEKEEQDTLTKTQMPPAAIKEEEAAVVCGVCLTEKALVERGKLNCCDHFFCFGCIMEWAKVESRCPMCKQRFVTIVKAGIGGSKRTRTVRIPLRDQVYIPPEDQDLPVEDLYADVVCMECHGTGDEGLLLLCDHCDSAAHTFCVGLGRSVPRGDWFCRACQALVAESSGSEDEEEELVLASSDEDEDSLIRAIVASGQPRSQQMTQTRVQRPSTSTTRLLPSSLRRRVRSGARRRLWRRLSGRGRGRAVSARRLSQAARALMGSTMSAPNQQLQALQTSHSGSQSGSARTVPQQRRLQERIHVMRSNWGQIQTGDLQFNALGMQSTIPTQPVILNATNVVPIPPRASDESAGVNKITLVPGESSTQGERELEQAWRMMDHAQNLSPGINISSAHQQRSVVSHQVPAVSTRQTNSGVTVNSNRRATNNVPCSSKNLDVRTNNPSPLSNFKIGNADANTAASCTPEVVSKMNHDGQPLEDGKKLRDVVPALTADSGECSKELQRQPLGTKQTSAAGTSLDCPKEFFRSTGSTNEKQEEELLEKIPNDMGTEKQATSMQGFESEKVNSSRHIGSADASRTHARKGTASMADKHDVSAAAGTNDVGNATFSSAYEGLKVHLTELVKKQIWPLYLTEGLGKEQFKQIARAAVHTLLALCDSNNESVSLSCGHLEHQGISPVASCCDKCLDHHVERAVKIAKHKVLPG